MQKNGNCCSFQQFYLQHKSVEDFYVSECVWNVWGIHLSVKLSSRNPLCGKHVSWPSAVPQNFPHVFQHFLQSCDAIAVCIPSSGPHVVSFKPSTHTNTHMHSSLPHLQQAPVSIEESQNINLCSCSPPTFTYLTLCFCC